MLSAVIVDGIHMHRLQHEDARCYAAYSRYPIPPPLLAENRPSGISTDFEPLGSPASAHGIKIMRDEHGVDMTSHRSAILSHADVFQSTHIYCMAQRHHDAVLSLERWIAADAEPSLKASHPTANGADNKRGHGDGKDRSSSRASPLVSIFEPEIPDPWHGTTECYRKCTEMIAEAVTTALEEDMPVITAPQQQQEDVPVNRRGEGEENSDTQS